MGEKFTDSNIRAQSRDVSPHAPGNLLSSKLSNVNRNWKGVTSFINLPIMTFHGTLLNASKSVIYVCIDTYWTDHFYLALHTDAHTFETELVKWINGCVSHHSIFTILNALLYFVSATLFTN
jgi:hypothetical protein